MRVIYIAVLLVVSLPTLAQKIHGITTEFDGDKVVITYDLSSVTQDQKFNVSIRSSHDGYAKPLKFLMGDAGANVLAGNRNRVIWDVRNELPADFNGSITLKIEAEVVKTAVEKIALNVKPLERNVYKRGNSLRVDWVGGSPNGDVRIELFKDNVVKEKLADIIGTDKKSFYWDIPKKTTKGEYYIRVSNMLNPLESVATQIFKVKSKTPALIKLIPIAAVGYGVYWFVTRDEPDTALPGPPGVPPN